jgi:hypothetical protein
VSTESTIRVIRMKAAALSEFMCVTSVTFAILTVLKVNPAAVQAYTQTPDQLGMQVCR